MAGWKLCLAVLLAGLALAPAQAQTGSFVTSGPMGLTFNTLQPLRFEMSLDPPSPLWPFTQNSTMRGLGGGETLVHRYFVDGPNRLYMGYDLLVQPDKQSPGYRLSFYELTSGVFDVVPPDQRGDPSTWKKLPIAALPATQVAMANDRIPVEVWVDKNTGQKLTDTVMVSPPLMRQTLSMPYYVTSGTVAVSRGNRNIPTVSGTAREFKADDAEMRLVQARVTLNGTEQDSSARPANVTGGLIWMHLPGHGRYVLSLTPRPELGFVKAGEVRGGSIKFQCDKDELVIDSPTAVAPGDAPYVLYVLHDADWTPVGVRDDTRPQFGSVSARELVLLQKKN